MNKNASKIRRAHDEIVSLWSTAGSLSNDDKQRNINSVLLMRNIHDILFTYELFSFSFLTEDINKPTPQHIHFR